MDSSKSNDSTNRGLQDSDSDVNEEDKNELCPGFKDADAFVKVSVHNQVVTEFLAQARSSGGQRGYIF